MVKVLLIALGGALGTLARYGTGTLLTVPMERTLLPWSTFTVNLVGCFLIGLFNGLTVEKLAWSGDYQQMVTIGFFGGFTTFSSFGYETFTLLRNGQPVLAGLNVIANNVGGFLLVVLGYRIGHGRL